jgi:predicted Zn-dependent protease
MADIQTVLELWRRGERGRAEALLGDLIAAAPRDAVLLATAADLYASTDRRAQALAVWRSLDAGGAADAVVLRKLGGALLDAGDAAAACDVLARAVAADPGNPRGLNNLGLALLRAARPTAPGKARRST